MDPSEISLKIAEITLATKRSEIWSDVLKIGIPSLIAVISLIITYFISKRSNEKDIAITKLKIGSDSKKETKNQEVELIKSISGDLSKVYDKSSRYTSLLAAKLDMLKDGLPFPKKNEDKLSELYELYTISLHDNIAIEASILLLGDEDITDIFRKYNSLLSGTCTNYAPHDTTANKYNELLNEVMKLGKQKDFLFRLLSKRYLAGYA